MTLQESPSVLSRRLEHERELAKVGVETEVGQRLLAKWAAENRKAQKAVKAERAGT